MKNRVSWLFSILTISCLAAPDLPAAEPVQQKIAIIDLEKVFDGYWKTKQADGQIKERAADFDKARRGMQDDYEKAKQEYAALLESANDQAVSVQERDKRKSQAEKKLIELREIEANVVQLDKTARETLGGQRQRMRDDILEEIQEKINVEASAGGYSLVIDTAAKTANLTSFVLFNTGQNDITDTILAQMNANAPTGALSVPNSGTR